MLRKTKRCRRGVAFRLSTFVTLALVGLLSSLSLSALADDPPIVDDVLLPGGTPLSVQIDSPTDGSTFPFGAVTFSGSATIDPIAELADTLLVYTVDLSFSTSQFGGQCGDANQDGFAHTILDCEVAAMVNLNDTAIARSVGEAGVVGFAGRGDPTRDAVKADVDAAAGIQHLVSPSQMTNGVTPDVERVLRSARYNFGEFELFTPQHHVGTQTNYFEGVRRSLEVANLSSMTSKIVVFVSDGQPTAGPPRTQLITLLNSPDAAGITFYTFSIGTANCDFVTALGALRDISDHTGGTCTNVSNIDDLPNIVPLLIDAQLTKLEVSIDGGAPVEIPAEDLSDTLPANGPATVSFETDVEGLLPGTHEVCVIATGTDPQPGTATACIDVTIEDVEAPVLSLPDDIVVPNDSGLDTAVVNFVVTAEDDVDGPLTVTCEPAPGSVFPVGETTVECEATDAAGNTATGDFTVTVEDVEPPALNLPDDFEIPTDPGLDTAVVDYTTSATDNVDGDVTVACDPPSGSAFTLGPNIVECEAVDASGNDASGSFTITVADEEPPVLNLPDDITVPADPPGGTTAVVSFVASASDNVDGVVAVDCVPASGSTFAEGETTVECEASDVAGNSATGSFTVTVVVDVIPPTTTAQADPVPNVNGWNNTPVSVELTAVDNPGGSGVVSITTSLSGTTAGDTVTEHIASEGIVTLEFFATDNAGNVEEQQQLTIRIDLTDPEVSALLTSGGDPYVPGTWTNQPVLVTFECEDALSGVDMVSAPVELGEGVNQTATGMCLDEAGNAATVVVTGINVDMTAPTCSCSLSPDILWSPNNGLVNVTATVSVSDSLAPTQITLLSVTSNEPDQVNPGDPPNDIQEWNIGTDDTSGLLRAQRLGTGTGRVYTFTYEVSDEAGNSTTCVGIVLVPHNQGPH